MLFNRASLINALCQVKGTPQGYCPVSNFESSGTQQYWAIRRVCTVVSSLQRLPVTPKNPLPIDTNTAPTPARFRTAKVSIVIVQRAEYGVWDFGFAEDERESPEGT
ncbi:hypothetical protein CIRG_00972 [Coccidioides immitis RMSCC 2394]|uniref:Uncharacterized protein n=1 Tax=Coccidioides immitis RMSCC 2394 TaxID=404692 RepID=A0A0J6XZK7_COCIT|nr:hypothetical protein CIRG_00972 [Coccidioides immitis RMSCC 2394]